MKFDMITDDIIRLKRNARKEVHSIERNIINGMASKSLSKDDRNKGISLIGSLKRMKRMF